MKLIIAGSRTFNYINPSFLASVLSHIEIDINDLEIVEGCARGVDWAAGSLAKEDNLKHKDFPADWTKYGKAAGHIRNAEMADYADALLIIWDGESKGSAGMKEQMLKRNKPVYEFVIKEKYYEPT